MGPILIVNAHFSDFVCYDNIKYIWVMPSYTGTQNIDYYVVS